MTIWCPSIHDRPESKYLAIANAIEHDVRSGRLVPGFRLPPHRELADLLGVTVGTVTRGYAEAERRGLTRGEIGRGTFIAGDTGSRNFLTLPQHTTPQLVDLSLVFPLYGQDPDLASSIAKLATRGTAQNLLQYQSAAGLKEHREAGVHWLSQIGWKPDLDEVVLCAGGQHALTVLLGTLCKPGDSVLAEELTYPAIKPLADMFDVRLIPAPMDEQGLVPDALESLCSRNGVKGLYTIPSMQNPTTVTLPEERRRAIAALCRRRNLWIIEDDCYVMTLEDPPAPLFTYAPERTFFVGSLSKTVAAGLRVAFLVSPREYVPHLESTITHTIWMVSPIVSEIASMWIQDGTALTVLRQKREEARQRNLLAEECLRGLTFENKPTGYFIWLQLPDPWTWHSFQEEALRRQVVVPSTEQFAVVSKAVPNAVRLSLSAPVNREDLKKALHTLTDILSQPPQSQRPIF